MSGIFSLSTNLDFTFNENAHNVSGQFTNTKNKSETLQKGSRNFVNDHHFKPNQTAKKTTTTTTTKKTKTTKQKLQLKLTINFLQNQVNSYLLNFDSTNALWFAERLLCEQDDLHSRLLLAKCYKQKQQYRQCYSILNSIVRRSQLQYKNELQSQSQSQSQKKTTSPLQLQLQFTSPGAGLETENQNQNRGFSFNKPLPEQDPLSFCITAEVNKSCLHSDCGASQVSILEQKEILWEARYLIACVCFKLRRYDECEEFLLGKKCYTTNGFELEIPNGTHGLFLMARVFQYTQRLQMAIKYYKSCLQLDSFHIGAINALCELGEDPGLGSGSGSGSNSNSNHEKLFLKPHFEQTLTLNLNLKPNLEQQDQEEQEEQEEQQPQKAHFDYNYSYTKTLFSKLSLGYFYLNMYDCQNALQWFSGLQANHAQSAWVLSAIARCYFEMNEYSTAAQTWKKQIRLLPYNLTGMEYYSTTLWQQHSFKELSQLSHHCSEVDKHSPQSWIVLGNCFSLNKSHDLAIKFFKRASKIDPDFAYAYTLAGHEYVVNEDFESALTAFQNAIRIQPRHYNAWYGLGSIYQAQDNFSRALYHFKKAHAINPNSPMLCLFIARSYQSQNRHRNAENYMHRALKLSNGNCARARYELSHIYQLQHNYEAAIREMQHLLHLIPSEWKIHFSLGNMHLKIGNRSEALMCFNQAISLNPKDKNMIRNLYQNVFSDEPIGRISPDRQLTAQQHEQRQRHDYTRRAGNEYKHEHEHEHEHEDDDIMGMVQDSEGDEPFSYFSAAGTDANAVANHNHAQAANTIGRSQSMETYLHQQISASLNQSSTGTVYHSSGTNSQRVTLANSNSNSHHNSRSPSLVVAAQ